MRGISELRTLSRGLAALAFLNQNGLTDIATLAAHLGIPRANVVRILKTLMSDGYCIRIPNSRFYQVSPDVRRLATGAREVEMLTFVSIPVIDKLGAALRWPVSLSTPQGAVMELRVTTDRTTSLALSRYPPGYQAEMPLSTGGILYLAFERPEIATALLAELREEHPIINRLMSIHRQDELIQFARDHGYVITGKGYPEGSIGVPILHANRPIGSLTMRYIRAGMTQTRLLDEILPELRVGGGEIQRLYALALGALANLR